MKKILTILSVLFVLSANAQQQISGPAGICAGQSATLIAEVPGFNTDTLQFQWSQNGVLFGLSNDTIVVNPGVGIWNYSVVIVTNGNLFVGNIYTTLTVNQLPTAAAIGGAFCQNSTISLTGGGGVSYSWSGPNGFNSNQQNPTLPATLAANGTYTLVVTNSFGCLDTTTTQVMVTAPPTANADSSAVSCNGGNNGSVWVLPNGGTPPYTYVWSNGTTTQFVPSLTAGTYNVTVTDANGCTVSAATAVTQPSPVTFTFSQTNVQCNGQATGSITVTATGGTPGYQYRLNNGAWTSVNTFSGLTAITHTIMVRDTNQCVAGPTNVTILEPNALVVNFGTDTAGCLPATGSAWVIPSGGQGPYTQVWSNSLGTNDTIVAGPGTYTVTVTDINNCQIAGTAVIAAPANINISAIVTNPTCFTSGNGSIDITVTGSPSPTFIWNNLSTTEDINGLSGGTYTVLVQASNGCQADTSFTLVNPMPINISASATGPLCHGGLGSAVSLTTGGTAPLSFSWSPSGGTASSANNLPAGSYTVIVTDANGCSDTTSVVVIEPAMLEVSIASQTNIPCIGNQIGNATAGVTGGTPFSGGSYQFLWSNGSQLNQAFGLAAGNHTVTVTDANGCWDTTSVTIIQASSLLVVQIYVDQQPCNNNGGITVGVSGGATPYTYQWNNGMTGSVLTGLAPGTYEVTVTDGNGCVAISDIGLQPDNSFTINTPPVINYCIGSGATVEATVTLATQPLSYQWRDPNNNLFSTAQAIEPTMSGIWTLIVNNGLGCPQTAYITINLVNCPLTSVGEVSLDDQVVVFPNPISFNGTATVQLPSKIHDVTIQLIDLTGKILSQENVSGEFNQLNTSGISSGTYMVRIASGAEVVTKRLIIQ